MPSIMYDRKWAVKYPHYFTRSMVAEMLNDCLIEIKALKDQDEQLNTKLDELA